MTYNIQCKPTWDRAIDRFLVLACIDKIVAAMKLKPALLAPLLMPLALLSAMLVLEMLDLLGLQLPAPLMLLIKLTTGLSDRGQTRPRSNKLLLNMLTPLLAKRPFPSQASVMLLQITMGYNMIAMDSCSYPCSVHDSFKMKDPRDYWVLHN